MTLSLSKEVEAYDGAKERKEYLEYEHESVRFSIKNGTNGLVEFVLLFVG